MAFSPNHPQLAALTASYVLGQAIVPLLQAVNRGFVRLTVVESDNASASHARQVMADVLQGLLPIVGLILLMAFTGGAWAMRVLFGANYIADWWLPGVVVLGMLGLSLSHLFSEALSNCGKLRERFVCMLAMGAFSIAITLSFSKLWGPPGGAAAIGVTGVSVLLALSRLVQSRIGDFWPWRSLRDVLASAGFAMAIGGLISDRVSQDDWPNLAAIAIAYFCGLLLTQEPGSQRLFRFLAARASMALGRGNPAIAENGESL
jgi:O-antigen/teichoic acid export membrane protein